MREKSDKWEMIIVAISGTVFIALLSVSIITLILKFIHAGIGR